MSTSAQQFVETYRSYIVPEGEHEQAAEVAAIGMVDRYNEPWRSHHIVPHLGTMAVFLVDHIEKIRSPRRVFGSTIGHDSSYDPKLLEKGANERLSAQLMIAEMGRFYTQAELEAIVGDILATIDHYGSERDTDRAFFLDSDMLIVGSDEQTFDEYDDNIREEFSFVPWEQYKEVRIRILTDFDKRKIFITQEARERYEDQAHANLARAIKRLKGQE